MNEQRVDFIGSTWFFLLGAGALCFLLVLLVVGAVFAVVWLSKRQGGTSPPPSGDVSCRAPGRSCSPNPGCTRRTATFSTSSRPCPASRLSRWRSGREPSTT